jgi:hypothetical protein
MEALLGKEYAKGTLTRYKTCFSHIKEFLNWKFNVSDIEITEIDHAFIYDFEFFREQKNPVRIIQQLSMSKILVKLSEYVWLINGCFTIHF